MNIYLRKWEILKAQNSCMCYQKKTHDGTKINISKTVNGLFFMENINEA